MRTLYLHVCPYSPHLQSFTYRSPTRLQRAYRRQGPRRQPSQHKRRGSPVCRASPAVEPLEQALADEPREVQKPNGVTEGYWDWTGYRIRYQRAGSSGPPVLLIHGFGGNCDHWRKNIPDLAATCRVYALDLLGYGYSDKPDPRQYAPNALYCFETWGQQVNDFVAEFVGEPVFLICNSVGGLVGLEAARKQPGNVRGVQLLDISLRMLHITKQEPWRRPLIRQFQRLLRETRLGPLFFAQVAKPQAVKNILKQCYGDKAAVTDELVEAILKPGLLPGAAAVFLDFISYSGGPTPEELLMEAPCPVSVLWGVEDPWEKVEWGRKFAEYKAVEEFIELPGVGHCPMDEAPQAVNPLVLDFVHRHTDSS